jgi:protein-tyrosine kinase
MPLFRRGHHNGKVSHAVELFLINAPHSATAEAFRTLRTALEFVSPEKTRVLAVTSPARGEGKTTCSANLAVALAHAGKRVLLIDADLRRPALHVTFRLERGHGLAHLLAGQCGDEAIQSTFIEGLDVLGSGVVPPNPSELLGSATLDNALARWRESYDHLLFDTPPLLSVTDAIVVARRAGQAILVARAAATRDRSLQHAAGLLREAGVEVLGSVLNDRPGPEDGRYMYYGQDPLRG